MLSISRHVEGRSANTKLDWEARRLLLQLSLVRLVPAQELTLKRLRRSWQLCVKAFGSREPVAEVEERTFLHQGHEVRLKIYTPARLVGESSRPALLWIHGGGFVFGDLYTAGATCRKLANECGCVVAAVQYRLAPESSLNAGLGDCLAAFRWLTEQANELGLNPKNIAVGGDSAGGAYAALVAQRCAEQQGHHPVAQVLAYPATDLSWSQRLDKNAPLPDRLLSHLFSWLQTQIPEADLKDPRLSPIRAPNASKLPPLVLVTAGFDPLHDQANVYSSRLRASGVPVHCLHFPGQFHGFMSFDRVLYGAQIAFRQIGEALRNCFSSGVIDPKNVSTTVSLRQSGAWLWLRPSQRLREAAVVCLLVRDGLLLGPSTK